ncbi:MAG: hypothetical protein A3D65_00110 [Candidatus Lloydbacteria bacterium RIFCSPHIGHO2_02_FULL_50_13]|uniref:Addiction module toxin, HicA family n=1 Tax=Candidatus Lloydbacteria bacterium RIFCSPHIGHO2_02_FULL_50_13 TaxID=1798661 RepID=A0A1G2D0K3_9BACT|nr:MAG: hypothetical protein A3D65_00110 [Candidatus Lloydbacteria bacterium RIFCSPHIGHO2_02_FULL_50_13]
MPKFYSSRHVVAVLQKRGFFYISQNGSHVKFRKFEKATLTVIVPANRKEIPGGTFSSIIRQSGLSREDFEKKKKQSS